MITRTKENPDKEKVKYRQKSPRRGKKIKKRVTRGKWGIEQNEAYLKFLHENRELFKTEYIRRSKRVFRKCSRLVKRRSPEQCRTHHQKYHSKYNGDIDKIIEDVKNKIKYKKRRKAIMEFRKAKLQEYVLVRKVKQEEMIKATSIENDLRVDMAYNPMTNEFRVVFNCDFLQCW